MAETVMTVNPQKVTVPSNTSDHTLNFDALLNEGDEEGTIWIENISGPMRFNAKAATDATISGVYTTTDKLVLDCKRGTPLHFRGAAGAETFQASVSKFN